MTTADLQAASDRLRARARAEQDALAPKPLPLARAVQSFREGATGPEPEYRCAACSDTGWVEVDDGLEDGRRVRAPREARCTSIAHERVAVRVESTPERFS